MTTIKEIARLAGVSATTVSNVINGNTSHTSYDTIVKVKKIIAEKKYVPNMGAMIVAHSFSRIIGIVLQYAANSPVKPFIDPFEGELVSTLEEEIRKNGYYTMLYVAETADEIINFAATWKIDGLIVIGLHANERRQLCAHTDRPVVCIDSFLASNETEYYNVGLKDMDGCRDMTNYLISLGHTKIAFLADQVKPHGIYRLRLNGVKAAFKENGLAFAEKNFIKIPRNKAARHAVYDALLAKKNEYTALFFVSDYFAADAVMYFKSKSISIPEDFSIAGFDDNMYSQIVTPKITTVHQDVPKKGTLAIQMLIKLMKKETVDEKNIQLNTSLVIRESTCAV
ncbi:MAG: LacI family DNA-binding transcriptional regulator [Treponema sp.]|nr:LacI family DNA-binding transcriptional regulator [Treponema sp.]